MTKYRRDIDGLRAFSVVAVIIFHLNPKLLPGGFVGVDVFFVISGYLISQIIISEIEGKAFTLAGFYERRVRRIIPALFALLVATSLASVFLLAPTPFIALVNSAAAAALSLSNVYFFRHSGYFDLGVNELPLLHTWSLAIEEQFYLAIPALFILARRHLHASWSSIIVPMLGVSLAVSILQTPASPAAAFYLPFARCWEFLLGAILVIGVVPRPSALAAELLGLTGFGLLVGSVAAINSALSYPGWLALLPCLGATLIIYTGTSRLTVVSRLLSLPLVVWVGLISYSLYLWHWPIIVFSRAWWGGDFSLLQSVFLIIGMFGLSWLSWRYVERPVRRNRLLFNRHRLFVGAAVAVVAFVGLRAGVNAVHGAPGRFEPQAIRMLTDDTFEASRHCVIVAFGGTRCSLGDPHAPVSFAAVGDSFGGALMPGIDIAASRWGRNGVIYYLGGCYPLLDVQRDNPICAKFTDWVFDQIAALPNARAILLIGRWPAAIEGQRFGSDNRSTGYLRDGSTRTESKDESGAVFTRGLDRVRTAIGARRLFLVAGIPEQNVDVPMAVAMRLQLRRLGAIALDRHIVEGRERRTRQILGAATQSSGLTMLDASPLLCDDRHCWATHDGRLLYSDDNHLSVYGSEFVARHGLYDPFFRELD